LAAEHHIPPLAIIIVFNRTMAIKISHTTVISASIDQVWKALIDIDDWQWNKWTRLEASQAKTGVTNWQTQGMML
jgi:hypothetical protein